MIDAETWLTGKEARDYFDIIVGKKQEILNCAGEYPKNFKNYLKILKQKLNQLQITVKNKRNRNSIKFIKRG